MISASIATQIIATQKMDTGGEIMTQELIDLRTSILAGRYDDALAIVDELEGMSKQAILRNTESFLVRLMVHLIKNQIEQRLTNSWVASISDSVRQIQKLNLKDNKTSHYINPDEWYAYLDEAVEAAIDPASAEVSGGLYDSFQLLELIDRSLLIATAQALLDLTYRYSSKDLLTTVREEIAQLAGGKEWKAGRS